MIILLGLGIILEKKKLRSLVDSLTLVYKISDLKKVKTTRNKKNAEQILKGKINCNNNVDGYFLVAVNLYNHNFYLMCS